MCGLFTGKAGLGELLGADSKWWGDTLYMYKLERKRNYLGKSAIWNTQKD